MKRNEVLAKIGIVPVEASRRRILIDTDAKNEADDQFAIMQQLLTPSFDVVGIVATHFETKAKNPGETMERSYQEIQKVLSAAHIDDVPYYRGCVYPLAKQKTSEIPEGVRFIIEEAKKPGRLYIVVQGAMTNVAAALIAEPSIGKNLTVMWNGGGPYPAGRSEFNAIQDIDAVNIVLLSTAEVVQTPQDVYSSFEVSLAELKQKVSPCGEIGAYLYQQLIDYYPTEYNPNFPLRLGENWTLGDNAPVGALLGNGLRPNFHMEQAPILEADGTYRPNSSGKVIKVYDSVDVRFTLEDFFAKMALAYGK